MRLPSILFASLVAVTLTNAECVVVEPVFQKAGERIHLTARVNGQPVSGSQVLVYAADGTQPVQSAVTNSKGNATLKRLSAGRYRVIATAQGNLTSELLLEIDRRQKRDVFVMDLAPRNDFALDRAYFASQAQKVTLAQRVRDLKGIVLDASGAPIPDTEVYLVKRDGNGDLVTRLKSDYQGAFRGTVPAGVYVGFFTAPGFRIEKVGFEVSPAGQENGLHIQLSIGGC